MKTILIADDHDHLRVLVSKTLGGPDYRILEARDGDEAFDVVLRHRPDIVILDWMMPGRSGIEVVQALRAHQETSEIPIVMLTAKAQRTSRAYATSLDVQGYLAKPFSPIELMETVEKILGEGSCT